MLKPWVVVVLLWGYHAGLAAMLGLALALGRRLRGWMLAALLASALATIISGVLLDYDGRTWFALVFCVAAFYMSRAGRWAWVVVAPLGVAGWVGVEWLVDWRGNENLPVMEVALGDGLACRAYPAAADSLAAKRLVVAKGDGGWFEDRVTEMARPYEDAEIVRCEKLDGGRVVLAYREGQREESVVKRVE